MTACGGHSPPAEAPLANAGGAPAGRPVEFSIGASRWILDVPGATHVRGPYTEIFSTARWRIEVQELPPSEIFVQTLAEELEVSLRYHPGRRILYQRDGGPDDWASVMESGDRIFGVQEIAGEISVTCTFELAAGADWRPALAACGKIRPRPVDGSDGAGREPR